MTEARQPVYFGVPWERSFGYAQAVKAGGLIFISGQLSHDESGAMVAPALQRADGTGLDAANMKQQMKQAYANALRVLREYGASAANVVEEVLYVTDMDAAFAEGPAVRHEFYGTDHPQVACTLIVTPRLALPGQLIEIKMVATV